MILSPFLNDFLPFLNRKVLKLKVKKGFRKG